MPPLFLEIADVLAIHQHQIGKYGGHTGIRDAGLLDSAIAVPQATFQGQFLHVDLFEMAAAYLFHIARNHAFVDGNKRTATIAAIFFLELNGLETTSPEPALEALVRAIAEGRQGKPEIAEFFRSNCHPSGDIETTSE